jgi:hypothetical protein
MDWEVNCKEVEWQGSGTDNEGKMLVAVETGTEAGSRRFLISRGNCLSGFSL